MEKKLHPRKPSKPGPKPQAVLQCDQETGEQLAYFPSIAAAAKSMDGTYATINQCLDKPNRTAYGYKWVRKHTPTPTDTQNPVYDP